MQPHLVYEFWDGILQDAERNSNVILVLAVCLQLLILGISLWGFWMGRRRERISREKRDAILQHIDNLGLEETMFRIQGLELHHASEVLDAWIRHRLRA